MNEKLLRQSLHRLPPRKTKFYVQYFIFEKSCRLWNNIKTIRYTKTCHRLQYRTHASCTLDNQGCRYTLRICKSSCFSKVKWLRERVLFLGQGYYKMNTPQMFRLCPTQIIVNSCAKFQCEEQYVSIQHYVSSSWSK